MRYLFLFLLSFTSIHYGYSMSLTDAMEQVLTSNPNLKAGKAAVEQARARANQDFSGFFPQVTGTAGYGYNKTEQSGTESINHPRSYALNVEQTLFNGGRVAHSYRAEKSAYRAQQASYEDQQQQVLLELITAYVNVLLAKDVESQNASLVNVLETQLKATEARFEQGVLTKTDVKQAQARLAAAKAGLTQAQGQIRLSRNALVNVLGFFPETPLTWPTIPAGLPSSTATAEAIALNQHPTLQSALALLKARQYTVKAARGGAYFPDISAVASLSRNEDQGGFLSGQTQEQQSVGLELTMPLYAGGRDSAVIRETIEARTEAEELYEAAKRDVLQELVDAMQTYQTATATFTSFEQAFEATKLATEGVKREHELGERSVLDMLDAEQELLDAQVNQTTAKRDAVVSAYRLLAAMGELTLPVAEN